MENKINIAELLKNCPKGMELDCSVFEDVTLYKIDTDIENEFPIRIKTKNDYFLDLTKYGTYSNVEEAKCLIFPKGKTTWEGFQRPFKDGDILTYTSTHTTTFIYRNKDNEPNFSTSFYVACNNAPSHNFLIYNKYTLIALNENCEVRLATEEEKQKLFDAIKANGYKWNAETKTLVKLPKFKVGDKIEKCMYRFTIAEVKDDYYLTKCGNKIPIDNQDDFSLAPNKFDITTLVPFESRVLVRDTDHYEWEGAVFGRYDGNSFFTIGGIDWKYCIPYEGNEHLFGTTNDCDDFYKTWKE